LNGLHREQKARHSPNNKPADKTRQFKPKAYFPGIAHKKTPDTMAGGKLREESAY
jgi:hypothetical protein